MGRVLLLEQKLTHSVIGAFYEVYRELGFGFLESIYAAALERELLDRGHRVAREVHVRVYYKRQQIGSQRVDMIIDEKLIVENKSSAQLPKDATRQPYNYLHATNLEVALLLHYGPKPAFYRVVCENPPVNPEHPPPSGASAIPTVDARQATPLS